MPPWPVDSDPEDKLHQASWCQTNCNRHQSKYMYMYFTSFLLLLFTSRFDIGNCLGLLSESPQLFSQMEKTNVPSCSIPLLILFPKRNIGTCPPQKNQSVWRSDGIPSIPVSWQPLIPDSQQHKCLPTRDTTCLLSRQPLITLFIGNLIKAESLCLYQWAYRRILQLSTAKQRKVSPIFCAVFLCGKYFNQLANKYWNQFSFWEVLFLQIDLVYFESFIPAKPFNIKWQRNWPLRKIRSWSDNLHASAYSQSVTFPVSIGKLNSSRRSVSFILKQNEKSNQ